jgi:hypothetical protein
MEACIMTAGRISSCPSNAQGEPTATSRPRPRRADNPVDAARIAPAKLMGLVARRPEDHSSANRRGWSVTATNVAAKSLGPRWSLAQAMAAQSVAAAASSSM